MSWPTGKIVAFLDLLGFSEAVKRDLPGAVQLLQDYAEALNTSVIDSKAPASQSASPDEDRLLHMMTVTSFETLLPMSDSIFITALDAPSFITQFSHFLVECFRFRLQAFAYPENTKDPRKVTIRHASFAGANSRMELRSETWWPVLFRGDIAVGEFHLLKLPKIVDSTLGVCDGLIGNAVVEAVRLGERKMKGPRILCSNALQPLVSGQSASYLGPPLDGQDECVELYWPMSIFEGSANISAAINDHLREWLLV